MYIVLYNINDKNMFKIEQLDFKKLQNTGIHIIDLSTMEEIY